jgi:hypothetical protein
MIKTEFMNLYEELTALNESADEDFEKHLVPKFKALKTDIDKASKALDNPNYVEILEDLKACVNGFKICLSINKQLMALSNVGTMINGPYDEAIGLLNRIEHIIFLTNQGDSALDDYLKDPYDWTVEELKDTLKAYEKYSDVDISKLDFSGKDTAVQPAEGPTTQQAEPKNAKLNRARQNNLKIIKAFKEVGLPADDLTITAKNKKGKDYRKASDKLNKLRKTLFGEALDDENVFNQDF